LKRIHYLKESPIPRAETRLGQKGMVQALTLLAKEKGHEMRIRGVKIIWEKLASQKVRSNEAKAPSRSSEERKQLKVALRRSVRRLEREKWVRDERIATRIEKTCRH